MADKRPKFLPRLGSNSPNPDDESDWHRHDGGLNTLADYAGSLEIGGVDAPPERLKSVPTPWARLVVFEHALFEENHPAHSAVVREWRGMLGCLALQQYERFEVSATGVDLGGEGGEGLLPDLRSMLENPDEARWDRLGLIKVEDELVGGTSPRTLVFTGIRDAASRTPIPWQREDRLTDPADHYYELGERRGLALLDEWLELVIGRYRQDDQLHRLLGTRPSSDIAEAEDRASAVLDRLGEWKQRTSSLLDELGGSTDDGGLDANQMWEEPTPVARAFHKGELAHDVYSVLAPVPYEGRRDNDLRLRNGEAVLDPGEDGLIVEADTGRPFTGRIRLAAGGTRQVEEGRLTVSITPDQLGDRVVNPSQHYADGLVEVQNPVHGNVQVLEGAEDYLFPFREDLVRAIGPDMVARADVVEERSGGVRVRLELPLEREGLHLRYETLYERGDVVDGFASPELAIWPDFEGEDWDRYFWVRRRVTREARNELTVRPVLSRSSDDSGDDASAEEDSDTGGAAGPVVYEADAQGYTWGETARPVRAWRAEAHRTRGLIFTDVAGALKKVDRPDHEWEVSVDFGSTHTRVYRAKRTQEGDTRPEIVSFASRAVPLLQGSGSLPISFFPAPDNEVGSREEPRTLVQLPLERVPDDRRDEGFPEQWLPVDGVVYWRSLLDRIPAGLRADLKWQETASEDEWAFQSYLSQLCLMVAAEAAAADPPATVASVTPAFPSVFPEPLRTRHGALWREVGERFGVDVPDPMMESIALAEYLTLGPMQANRAANLLAVDVGGSTADIAVWSGSYERAESDSVRMAGGVMTRLLGTDERAREAVTRAAQGPGIRKGAKLEWTGDAYSDGLRFAGLLRSVQRDKGSTRPLADNLYTGRGSDGERVIAHAGYLYAALSFLVGLMVRRAELDRDTYYLHFGGRGSGFLPWLDALGAGVHEELAATFFRGGLRPDGDVKVEITYSQDDAKEEVGRGILLATDEARSMSEDLTRHRHRTFLGESGLPGPEGEPLDWTTELDGKTLGRIQEPERPRPIDSYEHLLRFLEVFRAAEPPLDAIGSALGLDAGDLLDEDLRDHLHQRLYGPRGPWSEWRAYQRRKEEAGRNEKVEKPELLLEPFFVVEARALLEHATGNRKLFGA